MSSSQTNESADVVTTDQRQLVSDDGVAVGAESVVTITQVPDEAFDMAGEAIAAMAEVPAQSFEVADQAIRANSRALGLLSQVVQAEDQGNKGELLQLGDTLFKFAIPAALIAYALKK